MSVSARYFAKKPPVMRPAGLKPKPKKEPTFEIVEEYKHTVLANAYIGKKGYTISKSVLSKEDEAFLKKDLFCSIMASKKRALLSLFIRVLLSAFVLQSKKRSTKKRSLLMISQKES